MRELIKNEQLVTIVPQDFKNTNKGMVLDVTPEGFRKGRSKSYFGQRCNKCGAVGKN